MPHMPESFALPPTSLQLPMQILRSIIQKHQICRYHFSLQAFQQDPGFRRCRTAFHVTGGTPDAANELRFIATLPHLLQANIHVCLSVVTLLPRLLVCGQERPLPDSLNSAAITCKEDLHQLLLEASAHRICQGIAGSKYDAFISYKEEIGEPVANAQLLCGMDGERSYVHSECEVLVSGSNTGVRRCAACSVLLSALPSAVCKWECKQGNPTPGSTVHLEKMTRKELLEVVDKLEQASKARQQKLNGLNAEAKANQQKLAAYGLKGPSLPDYLFD